MKYLKLLLFVFILVGCSQEKERYCKFDGDYQRVVKFSGVGDNLIHGSIYRDAYDGNDYDFSKMYVNVEEDMNQSDIAFINQETPLGGVELTLSGYPMFNSPTQIARDLYEAGFNLVNLATNHSLDRYEAGIINELKAFREYDMVYDGVYLSQEDYDHIVTFEKKGIIFSFLAYTYGTNGITAPHSYNISYFDTQQIKKDIQKAKEISDFVIVSAHWGDENSFIPNDMQKYYAQLFADEGVDVVIGTHPHVIQPIEWVEGKNGHQTLVVYSLGNFIGGMLGVYNAVNGMIQFDIIQKNDEIYIDNVSFTPLFIHFEQFGENLVDDRDHYASYKVSEYTEELASKHALNGYENQVVDLKTIKGIINQVIDQEYLDESWKISK